jgi:hypothetical protein
MEDETIYVQGYTVLDTHADHIPNKLRLYVDKWCAVKAALCRLREILEKEKMPDAYDKLADSLKESSVVYFTHDPNGCQPPVCVQVVTIYR